MRTLLLLLLAATGCGRSEAANEAETRSSYREARVRPRRAGPRPVGCRERTMRLSVSMCAFGDVLLPSTGATPDALLVEPGQTTVDACLRSWERLAAQCDGRAP